MEKRKPQDVNGAYCGKCGDSKDYLSRTGTIHGSDVGTPCRGCGGKATDWYVLTERSSNEMPELKTLQERAAEGREAYGSRNAGPMCKCGHSDSRHSEYKGGCQDCDCAKFSQKESAKNVLLPTDGPEIEKLLKELDKIDDNKDPKAKAIMAKIEALRDMKAKNEEAHSMFDPTKTLQERAIEGRSIYGSASMQNAYDKSKATDLFERYAGQFNDEDMMDADNWTPQAISSWLKRNGVSDQSEVNFIIGVFRSELSGA